MAIIPMKTCTYSYFKSILIFGMSVVCLTPTPAQERCHTVEYQKINSDTYTFQAPEAEFERWVEKKIQSLTVPTRKTQNAQRTQGTATIPVVVHVIHKGEPIGQGVNISDEQIYSQIRVLNNDFKRTNADKEMTPAAFVDAAGSMDIEFVLAKQDPDRKSTTGIVRVKGTKDTWLFPEDDELLKATSYWPAELYLNFWVTDLGRSYVGYAQFPDSELEGLTDKDLDTTFKELSKKRLTDGVVIDYIAFGSIVDNPSFILAEKFDRGRTATHELGHFFGLRHVWGDQSYCNGNDYVSDTPVSSKTYSNTCPDTDQVSCSTSDMYSNFLYYTNDLCMNIFTKGQVSRMEVILQNSPRRLDLLTSRGSQPPDGIPVEYEMGLVGVGPTTVTCANEITPYVYVKNLGTSDLFTAQVTVSPNQNPSTYTLSFAPIPPQQTKKVYIREIALPGNNDTVQITFLPVNSMTDKNLDDNTITYTISKNFSTEIIPYRETFDGLNDWVAITGENTGWVDAMSNYSTSKAAKLNAGREQKMWLISPTISLAQQSSASFHFDLSYGYNEGTTDTLSILVSLDCGTSYQKEPLYEKAGNTLSVIPTTTVWQPSEPSHWRREFVDLTKYVGQDVRLAFYANGNGNSIFIDNIEFYTSNNPSPFKNTDWFDVYTDASQTYISFKLEQRESVSFQLYSPKGDVVFSKNIDNVLNQTYAIESSTITSGIYILRIITPTKSGAKRVLYQLKL